MSKLRFLLIFAIFYSVYGLQVELDGEWAQYKKVFNKTYNSECQEKLRRKNWEQNLEVILRHNLEADMGVYNFTLGLNEFSDMSHEEFQRTMIGSFKYNGTNGTMPNTEMYVPPPGVKTNGSVDYRTHGMVTDPQNQGSCGSCYAFCTCAILEAMYKKKKGKLIGLSAQNIVDCSIPFGNEGCDGGSADSSLTYVYHNHGIDTDKSYPYEMKAKQCRFNPENAVPPECSQSFQVKPNEEKGILIAVGTNGPVAAAMNANMPDLQHYKGGIYSNPECTSHPVDHCVTIIGYGTENGQNYWIVKNSWGTSWGEKGFFKIVRDQDMCRIASHVVFCT